MKAVNQPGPSNKPVNMYAGVALLGVILMAIGIVGGVFMKHTSALVIVATIIPGIGLLLLGIRGYGRDQI
jgi:hypothetical protein